MVLYINLIKYVFIRPRPVACRISDKLLAVYNERELEAESLRRAL